MTDSAYIFDVEENTFQQYVIENSFHKPVLVDFWAEWCNPCKTLMPLLSQIAQKYDGQFLLAKLDTEANQAIATHFDIRSIPAVKLFKNGEVVDEFTGALSETEIIAFLDKHIRKEANGIIEQIYQLLSQNQLDEASILAEQALTSDPDNTEAIIASAKVNATQGNTKQAIDLLGKLPAPKQEIPEIIAFKTQLDFDLANKDAPDQEQLIQLLEQSPDDSEARYQLASTYIIQQQFKQALDHLLIIMKKDRNYNDDAARKAMLNVFNILGDEPLAGEYRRKMFTLLH